MDEIFEAVEANRAAADERSASEARAAEASLAEWRRQEALKKKAAHRRADIALVLRGVLFWWLLWGLKSAAALGLVADVFAAGVLLVGFAYLSFFAGAWWQYRFGKGGVLRVSK